MTATVMVAFRDSDGNKIQTTSLPLGPWAPGFAAPPYDSAGSRTVFMSPSFLYYHTGEDNRISNIVAAKSVTVRGGMTLDNELLSRVNTVDASVRNSPFVPQEAFREESKPKERGLRRTPAAPPSQEDDVARTAQAAARARAVHAAMSSKIRAHRAENNAAFQSMWRSGATVGVVVDPICVFGATRRTRTAEAGASEDPRHQVDDRPWSDHAGKRGVVPSEDH